MEVRKPGGALDDVVTVTMETGTEEEEMAALVETVAVTTSTGTDEEESWAIDDEERTSVEVRASVSTLVETEAGAVAVTTTTGTDESDAVTNEAKVPTITLVGMTEDVTDVTVTAAAAGSWKDGDVLRDR